LFPIGTTTVTCTTSDRDDTPSTATSTFSVTVAGASAQLSSLRRAVQRAGHTNVLARTVARAQALLAAGRTRATCLTLGAFQREVGGLSHRFIAAAEARALIIDARRIQSVLACSPATGGHGRRLGAVASRAARVRNEPSRARRSSHRTT
jgi:hypothetical protein